MLKKYYAIAALAAVTLLAFVSLVQNKHATRVARNLRFDLEEFADEKYFEKQNFRVVSFGTSRTWGAGLENRNTQTYTALLNGTNLAIRSSMADYPALCTYSMLGDEIYDVITIEYLPQSYIQCKDSLVELGRRLRQRYPEALIIYINVWSNHQFLQKQPDHKMKSLVALATERAAEENRTAVDSKAIGDVASDLANRYRWIFQETEEAWLREQVKDPSIDGKVLHYELPKEGEYVGAIFRLQSLYVDDGIHFNEFGHQWVRHEIMKIIRENEHTRKDNVRPWEAKDSCESWIQSGEAKAQTNMEMRSFSGGMKFALESRRNRTEPNYIVLENDSGKDQHFYLSHMSSGPKDIYGGGRLEIHEKSLDAPVSYNATLDTVSNYTNYQIHVIKHEYIGPIKPGNSYIVIENSDKYELGNGLDFKTVGYVMSPADYVVERLQGNVDQGRG
mmetsp:Transcript_18639/g.28180  ORF Transcript_18639/g.28180 Transcript_18639/m.28180 type:complete len:447 (+) Transcript_18639:79-1419(+)